MPLRSTISTPEGKRRYVRRLFATIADRYDFITGFLSYGQDRRWKRRLIGLAALRASDRVLDLACGTGDLAFEAAPHVHRAVGLDVTHRMVELAARRAVKARPTGDETVGHPLTGCRDEGVGHPLTGCRDEGVGHPLTGCRDGGVGHPLTGCGDEGVGHPLTGCRDETAGHPFTGCRDEGVGHPFTGCQARFVTGDMLALPFRDATFDVVTTGYGLRNVPDLDLTLREIRRVLAPGGRLLALDFDRPGNALVRTAYLSYLTVVGSALGFALHRDPNTYRYIPESIRSYPGAYGVARLMEQRGFEGVRVIPVLGGLMAMHVARRT